MDHLAVTVYVKWMILKDMLAGGVHDFLTDEEGDVNIVSIVVLIGIAVLLAVVFKEQVTTLIENLFKTIGGKASEAVGGGGAGGAVQ